MRIKTINSMVEEVRVVDGSTAVNYEMLRTLFESKQLKSFKRGNRTVSDADQLPKDMNKIFGIEGCDIMPRIRSIRSANLELRKLYPELGISESRIRFLVRINKLPHIEIGNRSYVALESFEPPYNQSLIYDDYCDSEESLIERIVNERIEEMSKSLEFKK